MKRWIGRWVMGVAAVHTAFALVVFAPVLRALGVVLMPASGFWLALPPAFAVLLVRPRRPLPG